MRFLWDALKSDRTLAERGFDFDYATAVFAAPLLERADERRDYGEVRRVAVGIAHGRFLTVVFTDRGDTDGSPIRRIISARPSN